MEALQSLQSARRIGFVFSGGSARCAFQVGVVETLRELGVRPALCVGVSAGVWNAAAVAVGSDARLRYYWRTFFRMPHLSARSLLREHTPYNLIEIHRRTFRRYVGSERLRRAEALPLWVGVTRLADRRPALFEARRAEDPLVLLLASNYMPPFYAHAPRLGGERYGDGGLANNLPYEKAFEEGCDATVLITMKAESEGGLYRNPADCDHQIPAPFRERMVVIRPRQRLPVAFVERRWTVLAGIIELGRLRAREVLLGEVHPELSVDEERRPDAVARLGHALLRRLARG